jgi:hypothetical protein
VIPAPDDQALPDKLGKLVVGTCLAQRLHYVLLNLLLPLLRSFSFLRCFFSAALRIFYPGI